MGEFGICLVAYESQIILEHKTCEQSINFPGGSEFNCESEKPLQGAKMIMMDILEFINGPDLKGKTWTIKVK